MFPYSPHDSARGESMKLWIVIAACLLAGVTSPGAAAQLSPGANFGANAALGKYADINGIKLYYEIYGEGEPLMLFHGNGGSIASFASEIPELSKHFKVIAVDSRAQGKSTDSSAEITYALMASDMSALIDQLRLGSVNVMGWSDGGNVGLELALAHPEQVKKLVTFGANYTHVDFEAAPNDVKMQSDDPRVARTAAAIAEAKKTMSPRSPAVRKKLDDLMAKYPNITTAQLQTIEMPVLVIAGDHDAIKLEQTISLFRNLPHAQLWIVPGATHFVAMEQPDLVNRQVIVFLTTLYRDISTYYWLSLLP
jgi:pimeloyl-ACP methyl ester carboxylesterase